MNLRLIPEGRLIWMSKKVGALTDPFPATEEVPV